MGLEASGGSNRHGLRRIILRKVHHPFVLEALLPFLDKGHAIPLHRNSGGGRHNKKYVSHPTEVQDPDESVLTGGYSAPLHAVTIAKEAPLA
jgi:hypothetical protein